MNNLILLFFFFISSTSSRSVNTTHKCSYQQTLALIHFKQNLSSINFSIDDTKYSYSRCKDWLGSGYNPIMVNWNTSTDCCDWNGVTCDHSTGNVIGLDLSCGMMQGTFHPNTTLFDLPHLQRLNLAYNDFTDSQLPADIGVFDGLTYLNISSCGFTGQVPTNISHLHKLVSLDLSWNGLNLEPHVFINLLQNSTVMQELSLSDVYISTVLPTNLNISSSLKLLNLGSTGLKGNLPHNIFNLQSLENLDLSFNSLRGHIPSEITLLPKLVSLDLSFNGAENLLIQPHIFSILLKNSTFLRDLYLDEVHIGFVLPTYLNISSSIRILELQSCRLQGKLPDNILNLKYLEVLSLSANSNLSGPLPKVNTSTSIPLWGLDLSGISLSGETLTSIGNIKSLVGLVLSNCGLKGSLPKFLGNLRYLKYLYLSSNMLSGTLPSSLFTLPFFKNYQSLETLSLANNQLTGKIDVLDNRPNLEYLDLSSNMLFGTLPSSLFTLPFLKIIDLSNNMFQGNMPLELFSLQSLETLSLANNQLTGKIDVLDNRPSLQTFQRLTNLTYLDLSNNSFSGDWELSTLLSSLTKLDTLILSYSGISITTGNNANNYVNPKFQILRLASCSLKVFPVSVRAMKSLILLDLSNNDIKGNIPDWVGVFNQLLVLDLSNNSINGTIPNVYEDWENLQGFNLNGNCLEGKVPASLYKCQFLSVLDLGNNHLNDTFPGWLGDLPNLQVLVLRSNNFHGGIVTSSTVRFPFPSLLVLDLSHNEFSGQLPAKYLQNFNAMKNVEKENTKPQYIYMYDKYYSITIVVKGVDQYFPRLFVDYTVIDLSGNKFEGEIPNIIGNLSSLKVLNLSHNSLRGRIPHALGNISEIESLDLSWNQLIGEIPQSLADLTFLEILNLSQNNLMGHIPQGKQFNTFEGNSFGGNPKLCGLPLTIKCSERLHEPQLEADGDEEEENGFTWKVVMMGYGCGALVGIVLGYLMLSTGRPKWLSATVDVVDHMLLKRQNKRR